MIEMNGMAHVILRVSEWDACVAFYRRIMPFLGLPETFGGTEMLYFVGARTAIGIMRCEDSFADDRFDQRRVGLHHLCLRARAREDVDAAHAELVAMGASIVHGPEAGEWAPGYYSVLFEDPCGTRLEVNHVPGKGVLAEDAGFNPGEHYR